MNQTHYIAPSHHFSTSDSTEQSVAILLTGRETLRQRISKELLAFDTTVLVSSTLDLFLETAANHPNATVAFVDEAHPDGKEVSSVCSQMLDLGLAIPSVLIATTHDYELYMAAVDGGIAAILPEDFTLQKIETTLARVGVFRSLAEHHLNVRDLNRRMDLMSAREKQVIEFAVDGMPNKKIANRLGVSIKTVERDRKIAYEKLGVQSTAEMAKQVTIVNCHELTASRGLLDQPQCVMNMQ